MKRHILALALVTALTSFSATSKADNIISLTDSFNYPQGWPNGLEQLYFDGSSFSVAPYSANNSTSHGWNIYNDISMMGGGSGLCYGIGVTLFSGLHLAHWQKTLSLVLAHRSVVITIISPCIVRHQVPTGD